MQTEPHFDLHSFANRQARPVSQETRIAFEDYARMGVDRRGTFRRNVPEFANNAANLRLVIAQRIFNYTMRGANGKRVPEELLADYHRLLAMADARFLKIQKLNFSKIPFEKSMPLMKHIAAVRRAGGIGALVCAIAYRAWRLGQDSVTIANGLGITPWNVRQQLHRLVCAARKLGLEGASTHWSAKPRKPQSVRERRENMSAKIKAAWARGDFRNRKNVGARPGYRENMSAKTKAAHARGDFRNRKRAQR